MLFITNLNCNDKKRYKDKFSSCVSSAEISLKLIYFLESLGSVTKEDSIAIGMISEDVMVDSSCI